MSETKKLLFSNFENKLFNYPSKNELLIEHIENATANNHVLESYSLTSNFFESLLSENDYDKYIANYYGLESVAKRFIPYQYTDAETGETKLRIIVINNENCICEYIPSDPNLINYEQYLNGDFFVVHDIDSVYIFNKSTVYIFRKGERLAFYENSIKLEFIKFYKDKAYFVTADNPNKIFISADNPNKIFISTEQNLSNIIKGTLPTETLDFDSRYGKFQDLLVCDDCFYIVQDFGIAKIQIKKDETLFSYFKTNAKVIKNTSKVVNKFIVFLSSSGLVRFDGNKFVLICSDIIGKCDKNGTAETFNNKYYLSTNLKDGETVKNVLFEVDVEKEDVNILEIGKVNELFAVELFDKYILQVTIQGINSNETIAITGNHTTLNRSANIRFNKCFLDSTNTKSINKIKLTANGRFSFAIESNTGDKFSYNGVGPFDFNNICLFGHYFVIIISSMYDFKIESIYIEYLQVENDVF